VSCVTEVTAVEYPKAHVVLHLADPLSDCEVDDLQQSLEGLAGVARVEASMRLARLFVIDHDPNVVSAMSILTSVTRRGYAAALIRA
jgi:copper chaperone CopZ